MWTEQGMVIIPEIHLKLEHINVEPVLTTSTLGQHLYSYM